MREITVRKVNWKIFILNTIAVIIPIYFVISYAYKIQNTTMQTVFVIVALSIIGMINFLIVKKGTSLIQIVLKENELEILDQNKILYSSKYDNIKEYNIYKFISKRGGYILRLKNNSASFFSLLTWTDFNNVNDKDVENFYYIEQILAEKITNRKKTSGNDVVLKTFSFLPYVFLILAILFLAGIFIYFIYYIE